MKNWGLGILIIVSSFAFNANADIKNSLQDLSSKDISIGNEFELSDAMNWGDCFDYSMVIRGGMCGIFPTIILEWDYWDPVALIEVVPDPWRSFLYDKSFFNYESRASLGIANKLPISPGIGSGYRGRKSHSGKENSGTERENVHIWAVSDWARLETSNWDKACRSLTCKLEDYTGCYKSILKTPVTLTGEMADVVAGAKSGNYKSKFVDMFNDKMKNAKKSLTDWKKEGLDISNMELGGADYKKTMPIIDFITYSKMEGFMVRYVASKVPFNVHPIFMTERHQNMATGGAAADGGMILKPFYASLAGMGAGYKMPILCAAKNGISAAGEGLSKISESFGNMVMGWADFANGQCSPWGPLEPRVTQIGTGDRMVAAGLAGLRGFVIAQNLSKVEHKVLNPSPYDKGKFNLDWPHQSDCYNFVGVDALSRGWTSPTTAGLGKLTNAIKTGGIESLTPDLNTLKNSVTKNAVTKQGGQVFTYWRHRHCSYNWLCRSWHGDTGL